MPEAPPRDKENRKIAGASPVGCIFAKRIPRQLQVQQTETNENAQRRIPILYVPLSIFGCLGDPFRSCGYNNLLHFVHKLLHSTPTAPKSCTSFTNCLQTVAKRENLLIRCLDRLAPFPVVLFPALAGEGGCGVRCNKMFPEVPLPFPYKLRGTQRPGENHGQSHDRT